MFSFYIFKAIKTNLMKKIFIIFYFILLFAIFFGCTDQNQSPFIAINSPTQDTTIRAGTALLIIADAADVDGTVTEISFSVNDEIIQTVFEQPYQFSWLTENLPLGEYFLTITAIDDNNEQTSTTLVITIASFKASVVTDSIINVTQNSANISGKISDNGGAEVTEAGICWNSNPNPEISDNNVDAIIATDSFKIEIAGLESNKTYYARAYAINENGISYGNELSFKTNYELGNFTDIRDNKTYKTVKIGNNWWMAENLAYLPQLTVPSTGSNTEAYNYVYDQTSCGCMGKARANENYKMYGTLYNWTSAKNICPEGWHLPTDEEWESLAVYISNDNLGYIRTDGNWENVGHHLKSTEHWGNDGNGINNYGFSVLPGGLRDASAKEFLAKTYEGYFWAATVTDGEKAVARMVNSNNSVFQRSAFLKGSGFSVRCVKD